MLLSSSPKCRAPAIQLEINHTLCTAPAPDMALLRQCLAISLTCTAVQQCQGTFQERQASLPVVAVSSLCSWPELLTSAWHCRAEQRLVQALPAT